MKRIIRVGTRESKLAIAQSEWVINEIRKRFPQFEFEMIGIKTSGDVILDQRLDKIGGKGLFIKELENALINRSIDMAVHSMKDMPTELPEDLTIAAISKREDPRDALITSDGKTLEELGQGTVIGTSSLRREVQILQRNPGIKVKTLRGNVLTRINKLIDKEYDAILLAMAGLKRLGLQDKCVQCFSVEEMIPAVGQGALAIETRKDEDIQFLLDSVNDDETALAVSAERAFMIKLNGGCSIPIGAHAVIEGDIMKVHGMLAVGNRPVIHRASVEGSKYDAVELGQRLADIIMEGR